MKYSRLALFVLLFGLLIIVSSFGERSTEVLMFVHALGYPGLLLASFISGFNVLFPIPIVAFLPLLLTAGFSFWTSLTVMTLGMTLGDSLGFIIGKTGRSVLHETSPHTTRIRKWVERKQHSHPLLLYSVLFLYAAFVPFPNELFVVPMAFFGYKYRGMVTAIFLGNAFFNTLIAFGIVSLAPLIT